MELWSRTGCHMVGILTLFTSVTIVQSETLLLQCDDNCLLSKLGITKETDYGHELVLHSYDMLQNSFTDDAQIWIHPTTYFSSSFIQTTTQMDNPSDEEVRNALYDTYIAPMNIPLVLKVDTYGNIPTNVHPFEDYIFDTFHIDAVRFDNEVHETSGSKRVLLGNCGVQETDGTDYNDLTTYDGYDWFIVAFVVAVFGCCCMCGGCCCHRLWIRDRIIDLMEVQGLKTPISPSATNLFSMRNIFGSLHGKTPDFGKFLTPRPGRRPTADSHMHFDAGMKVGTSSPPEAPPSPPLTPIAGEDHAAKSEHLKDYRPKKPGTIQIQTSLDRPQHSGTITPDPRSSNDFDVQPQGPSKYSAVGKSVPAGTLLTPRGLTSPTAESRSAVEIDVAYGSYTATPNSPTPSLGFLYGFTTGSIAAFLLQLQGALLLLQTNRELLSQPLVLQTNDSPS